MTPRYFVLSACIQALLKLINFVSLKKKRAISILERDLKRLSVRGKE